jgi:hypothetical protein
MSYLKEKVKAPVYNTEITAVGIRRADHTTSLYPQKSALKFFDRRQSLSLYSSLAD